MNHKQSLLFIASCHCAASSSLCWIGQQLTVAQHTPHSFASLHPLLCLLETILSHSLTPHTYTTLDPPFSAGGCGCGWCVCVRRGTTREVVEAWQACVQSWQRVAIDCERLNNIHTNVACQPLLRVIFQSSTRNSHTRLPTAHPAYFSCPPRALSHPPPLCTPTRYILCVCNERVAGISNFV